MGLLLLKKLGQGVSRRQGDLVNTLDSIPSSMSGPLHYACGEGHLRVVQCLIEHNADINLASHGHAQKRQTPLMRALLPGNDDHMPTQDKKFGEEKEASEKKRAKRKEKVVHFLLGRKCEINVCDATGRTAMHYA